MCGIGFSSQDHVQGSLQGNESRQPLRTAPAGKQAQFNFRETDTGALLCGQPVIAGQDEFGAAAHAVSVYSSNGRKREIGNFLKDQLTGPRFLRGLLGGGNLLDFIHVRAGDKSFRLAAAKDGCFNPVPVNQLVGEVVEGFHE